MKIAENSQLVKNILSGSLRFEDRYIPKRNVLLSAINTLQQSGYRVVLTMGVYDLFHVGHKRYLETAKSNGDILVVAVDTDERARERKGPNRPFDKLNDRLEILTALRTVDIVTLREVGEDVRDFIKDLQPDVFIMSDTTEDFTAKDKKDLLKYCSEITVLPAQASTSTTGKLRRMMVDGAEQLAGKITILINDFLKGNNNESSHPVSAGNSHGSSGVLQKTKAGKALHTRKKSNR
ncbi:MAG: adenylyltransferase/cytidyltransferase family protein [Patescibacteria group bacterium]